MRGLFVILISVASFLESQGQVRISATPTGQHAALIAQAKAIRDISEQADKIQQDDSIKAIKADTTLSKKEKREQIRAYRKYEKRARKAARNQADQETLKATGHHLPDSIPDPPVTTEDSLKWAMYILAGEGQYEEISRIQKGFEELDSADMDSVGYLAAQKSARIAESFLPEEVKAIEAEPVLPDPNQLLMSEIPDTELPHAKLDELLSGISPDQLDESIQSIQNLKSRYSELPDIRYPQKSVPKNSLKGAGMANRLQLGGNIALKSTDPVITDIDLQLGWRMTKKWVSGSGVLWRQLWDSEPTGSTTAQHQHGYSVFSRYDLIHHFFVYGECFRLRSSPLWKKVKEQTDDTPWQYQLLVGVGSEIALFGKANMTIIMGYDFNHRHNDLNSGPWVLKVGYQLKGLPTLGKK